MPRFRLALVTLTLFATLLAPAQSRAVQLDTTCAVTFNGIINGSELLQGTLVGQMIGTVGMLANLLCFVGDPQCNCFRNLTDSDSFRNDQFTDAVAEIIAQCSSGPNSGRRLSGISQEAALNVCR